MKVTKPANQVCHLAAAAEDVSSLLQPDDSDTRVLGFAYLARKHVLDTVDVDDDIEVMVMSLCAES